MKNNNQVINKLFKNLLKITWLNSYKETFDETLQASMPGFLTRFSLQLIDSLVAFILRILIAITLYPVHKIFLGNFNTKFVNKFGDVAINFSDSGHFEFYLSSLLAKWILLYFLIIFLVGIFYNITILSYGKERQTLGMKATRCSIVHLTQKKISLMNIVLYSILFYVPFFIMIITIYGVYSKSTVLVTISVISILLWYEGGMLFGERFKLINKISKLVIIKTKKKNRL